MQRGTPITLILTSMLGKLSNIMVESSVFYLLCVSYKQTAQPQLKSIII